MKIVMVIDNTLPVGLIANTAAVLGLSLGQKVAGLIGPDTRDGWDRIHNGITAYSIPILEATDAALNQLREELFSDEFADVTVIDFCDLAQRSKHYDEYIRSFSQAVPGQLQYLGLCLCGPPEKVNRITGQLRLLKQRSFS